MNPVVGLFAVGLLGRIRTRRHRRRRREVGVSSWPDFEAPFPPGAPVAGEPRQAREQQKLRPAGFPLTTPNPTLPAPSFLPENSVGRTQAMPTPWGLGPGPAEAEAARGRAVEGAFIPGALGAGVGSRARLFPTLGAPHKPFLEHNLPDREPGFAPDGKPLGDPAQEGEERLARAEERASRAPGPAPPPGEGQRRGVHLLFPSPRSPRRRSSRSPRAGPADRRGPGRSGRSWISAGWKAAASQSEPGPDPPRCGQRGRVRRLHGTPTRDPRQPRTHGPPLPRKRPRGGALHSGAPCPPDGGIGVFSRVLSSTRITGRAPPTNSQKRCESFVWVLRRW